jgi:hypothetical protein
MPPPTPRSHYASQSRFKIPHRSLILYGSHLGGTLATSLALTECKASKNIPVNIAGLVVRDGVFDWTHVATTLNPSPSPTSPSPISREEETYFSEEISKPWTLDTLYKLRTDLFANPASTFDAFASPTLFFRTSGLAVPKSLYFPGCESPTPPPPTADLASLTLSDAEYAALSSAEFDSLPTTPEKEKKESLEEPSTPRATNMKFPPRDSGLKIPRSLFLTTTSNPDTGVKEEGENELAEQAAKIVRLMRRSVVMHEFKEKVLWDEDLDPRAASEERVQFVRLREEGSGEEDVVEKWLEGVDY